MLRFQMFYIRCCPIFKCFNFNTSFFQFIKSAKVTELPSVGERVANSVYHLSFCCLLRYVCPSFILMSGISFGFLLLFTWLSLVMSMMVSFVLSFFPRDVLDEILNLIESVSEDFPSYSYWPVPEISLLL